MSVKLDKLRAVVGAMSQAPWRWDEDGECVVSRDWDTAQESDAPNHHKPIIETDNGVYGPTPDDRNGIIELRNHAAQLLEIALTAEACLAANNARERADASAALMRALLNLEKLP